MLNKINEYIIKNSDLTKDQLLEFEATTVGLAKAICEYAHRNQKRENGEDYANHPFQMLQEYRRFVGIVEDDPFCIDKDLLWKNGIPFDGVQEVCLLHDVIEDTEFTLEDVKKLYVEQGFQNYFEIYIESPLKLITHDKTMPYDQYIGLVLKHPTSALVKLLDLYNNLNPLTLVNLDEKVIDRMLRYETYIVQILCKYNFINSIAKYREEFYRE